MIKRTFAVILAVFLTFSPITVFASGLDHNESIHTNIVYAKLPVIPRTDLNYASYHGISYHSRSQSRRYGNQNYSSPVRNRFSGIGSHLFSFGAGWLLGRVFHPFGGGIGYHPFSLFRLLFDIFIVLFIIWLVRRIFRRR